MRVTNAGTGEFEITRLDTGERFTGTLDASNQLHFGGLTVTVSAGLVDGDRFLLQPVRNAAASMENQIHDSAQIAASGAGPSDPDGGSGNNENALALQTLQNELSVGGTATFNDTYASIVSDVGNWTNVVQINQEAQESLKEQLRELQLSDSGVNLDEEAANLLRFQQYYQANAKVIQVASTLMDEILQLR